MFVVTRSLVWEKVLSIQPRNTEMCKAAPELWLSHEFLGMYRHGYIMLKTTVIYRSDLKETLHHELSAILCSVQ